ncbi:hypothetical protein ACEQUB_p01090 (plasmid) [Ralstonia syzygii]
MRGFRSILTGACLLLGLFFSHVAFADEPSGCPAGRHCTIPVYKVGFVPPDSTGWTAGQYDSFPQACAAGNGIIVGQEQFNGINGTPNVPVGTWLDMHQSNCQYDSEKNVCMCDETLVEVGYTHKGQSQNLGAYTICPPNTALIRVGNTDYCATPPTQTCPVADLTPITDPVALQHENGQYSGGHPDLDHVTQTTRDGTSCIVQHALAQAPGTNVHPTSGFRPPAYQRHIRECVG